MSDKDVAVELFRSGCACSQAILGAYGPRYGITEGQAMRVAAGFGGGMGMAETCGVVTGAVMLIGLACCDDACKTRERRTTAHAATASFVAEFRRRHGTLVCRELLGCDVSTPEGALLAKERGLSAKCEEFVRSAAEIADDLLNGAQCGEAGPREEPGVTS
ncbi:MAG: C_GCAxxG_C_C family protein [Actinobacteria bacterium]|nr:C_GCAxxG_C_C family protein [Actinomycetota bacterium]